jgi:hypothetical protein
VEELMARLEREYKGLHDSEIQWTIWDVRERDGGFEPYIIDQIPRSALK